MSEINTVLYDLDDTLLGNVMDRFLPGYFHLLAAYAQPMFADKEKFIKLLVAGTHTAMANTDPDRTIHDVFWASFAEYTGLDPAEAEPFFNEFYDTEFLKLAALTEKRREAEFVVEGALERGWQVVVATNPLFPRRAIEHRLEWAGVPVTKYPYALVTSYEIMHASKPHVAYYQEILDVVEAQPGTTLMVGDDWENDMVPAGKLGIGRYWITADGENPPDHDPLAGRGTLRQFYEEWIRI